MDLWVRMRGVKTQAEKAESFRALHQRDRAFIIPNPWDAGSARLLELAGFEALATTSAGFAFSVARRDNAIGRERMLAHVAEVVAATDLPVSADLENGFGDDPEACAETIRQGAAAGLAGGSIEDSTDQAEQSIYDIEHAADRVRAAAEAARACGFPFTLTARCENFLIGRRDLADTIRRLQRYQEAGADVLYAPGLSTREEVEAVVRAVDRPVNVIMPGVPATIDELSAIGVRRISVGSLLARAAYGALLDAARELRERGTFDFAAKAVSYRDLSTKF